MKICIINSLWGTYARGGAEQVLKLIIAELQRQKHEVFLITTQPKKSQIIIEDSDLKVYYLSSNFSTSNQRPYWQRFFEHIINVINFRKYYNVKKILTIEKPDIVWSHNLIGLGFLVFKLFGKPNCRHLHTLHDIQLLHPSGLLIREHENIVDSFVARVYQLIIKLYISPQLTIISPSQWLLNLHKQHGFFVKNHSLVLVNPVKKITTQSYKQQVSEEFTFLYIGQIEKHKGIELLIKAFNEISNQYIRLVVVGDGSLFSELQERNTDNRVTFKGKLTSQSVLEVIKMSDCLVVPSMCYENFPTVILEAMTVNLPVIGSNFGGIKEMLVDQHLLFEITEQALREKLLWASKEKNQLTNISQAIFSNFTMLTTEEYCKKLDLI